MKQTVELALLVDYDTDTTNPDEVATALDKLLETAASTPGVLADRGISWISEFQIPD